MEAKIMNVNPSLEGWCSNEKALAMARVITDTKPAVCVEIGIFGGRSLIAMATAMKFLKQSGHIGHVHGIDPWLKNASIEGTHAAVDQNWWGNIDHDAVMLRFYNALSRLELTDVCSFYRTTADRAVGLFDKIDVLHIDGNHSKEVSCRDVNIYFPKVKVGGFIWFDDVDWPTTKDAWTKVEQYSEKVFTVGGCNLYRKKSEFPISERKEIKDRRLRIDAK